MDRVRRNYSQYSTDASSASLSDRTDNNSSSLHRHQQEETEALLVRSQQAMVITERLVVASVSDPSAHLRSAVLSAFADNPFDAYLHPYIHNSRQQHHLSEMLGLGSLDNLRCLFIALNDESLTVRRAAMCTLGRLARRELGSTNDSGVSGVKTDNGQGIVWPQLRATLLELLVSLESAAARLYGGSAFGGSGSGIGASSGHLNAHQGNFEKNVGRTKRAGYRAGQRGAKVGESWSGNNKNGTRAAPAGFSVSRLWIIT